MSSTNLYTTTDKQLHNDVTTRSNRSSLSSSSGGGCGSISNNNYNSTMEHCSHHHHQQTTTTNNNNNNEKINHQYLIMSNAMRTYIESLPEKLTIIEELSEYKFWKSLRTEFIATFLYVIFTSGILSISYNDLAFHHQLQNNNFDPNISSVKLSEQSQLKNALAVGLTVSTLVQCTGHVCGCHLSIAITIGLYVSARVSPLKLASYLFIQLLASILGAMVVHSLFGILIPITPSVVLTPFQVFGFEFLATFLIVLTYLANCDPNRHGGQSIHSLSIGLAYTVGHLFTFIATGASLNPAKALAVSIITGRYCLHWIYWISPLISGLFGGLIYEYIGSIKPQNEVSIGNSLQPIFSELQQQFNNKNHKKKGNEKMMEISHTCHPAGSGGNDLSSISQHTTTNVHSKIVLKPKTALTLLPSPSPPPPPSTTTTMMMFGGDSGDDNETEFPIIENEQQLNSILTRY